MGIGKKEYLVEELGEGTVALMKKIKKTIDPLGLFNPGKVCAFNSNNRVKNLNKYSLALPGLHEGEKMKHTFN